MLKTSKKLSIYFHIIYFYFLFIISDYFCLNYIFIDRGIIFYLFLIIRLFKNFAFSFISQNRLNNPHWENYIYEVVSLVECIIQCIIQVVSYQTMLYVTSHIILFKIYGINLISCGIGLLFNCPSCAANYCILISMCIVQGLTCPECYLCHK